MPGAGVAFGPFQFDLRSRRLLRSGTAVLLPDRQLDLLSALVANPGAVLTKDHLTETAWRDVAVGDNSLAQAISQLRATLDPDDRDRYIATVTGRGYRFVAPVLPLADGATDAELDALLAPHRALIEGRAALETLERTHIANARSTFERLVSRHADDPTFHIGLANACALQYESTRADAAPDLDALQLSVTHARQACRLYPAHGEAWATLGFVLERTGAADDALAALRRATTLEPDNWQHHLRLAAGSWGEQRLRAARRTIALMGECALADFLAATVYVARGRLTEAERDIDAGLAAMPWEPTAGSRFAPVALYWLKGLLCLARADEETAMAAFEKELALEPHGQLYARECCANTWYAIGAYHLRRRDESAARAAFEQTVARVPLHLMAHAALASMGARRDGHEPAAEKTVTVDLAMAQAIGLVGGGDPVAAANLVAAALESAPPGNAGWLVPIEPLLGVHHGDHARLAWKPVLNVLRSRAS